MTNAERTFTALKDFNGKVLSSKQIQALTVNAFPSVNLTSIMPSDYVVDGKYSRGLQFLEKAGSGYKVVSPVKQASTRGARGESLDAALKSAMALIATPDAPTGETAGEMTDADETTE